MSGLADALSWWGGWLPAFVLTCVIEIPVYQAMLELFGLVGPVRPGSGELGRGRAVLLVLGVNVATHPLFWAVALGLDGTAELVAGEVVVTLVEAGLLWLVLRRRPGACLVSAAVANVASAVLGSAILGWAVPGAVIGAAS